MCKRISFQSAQQTGQRSELSSEFNFTGLFAKHWSNTSKRGIFLSSTALSKATPFNQSSTLITLLRNPDRTMQLEAIPPPSWIHPQTLASAAPRPVKATTTATASARFDLTEENNFSF